MFLNFKNDFVKHFQASKIAAFLAGVVAVVPMVVAQDLEPRSYTNVPIGSYENGNLINMGANRWMVRPGLGMSFKSGRWYYDLITSVRLYEDNDDFSMVQNLSKILFIPCKGT